MAVTCNPSLVVVWEISSMTASSFVSGLARQLMEMKEKSRCSILFQGHGSGRIMSHGDREVFFIGQRLEGFLPQFVSHAIATSPIGSDQEFVSLGIKSFAKVLPPPPDTLHSELRCLMIDAEHSQ